MRPKILVVEDSPYWQLGIRKYFEAHGYDCEVESNALGALSRLGWEDFDAVVLDWELKYWTPEGVEQFIIKRDVPACYFTAHHRGDLKGKTTLPIVEKCEDDGGGFAGLARMIESLLTKTKKQAAYG